MAHWTWYFVSGGFVEQQAWSWILTFVGLLGFFLAGRQVWWAWYINIGCQVLWFDYAMATDQHGFMFAALAYTAVFGRNALVWTKKNLVEQMEVLSARRFEARRKGYEITSGRYRDKWT